MPNLSPATRDLYNRVWTLHIAPRLGDYGVRELTPKRPRIVDVLPPLVQDLNEWRILSGRPGPSELIVPTRDGNPGRSTTGATGVGGSTSLPPRPLA